MSDVEQFVMAMLVGLAGLLCGGLAALLLTAQVYDWIWLPASSTGQSELATVVVMVSAIAGLIGGLRLGSSWTF
jgi:predicted lysophospholipase L1 biosynthesis ABC-type transport system permease subunit